MGQWINENLATGFTRPDTLAFDKKGNFGGLLYVASRYEGTIHTVDITSGEKKLFAEGFNTAYGLTFGPKGCLYVSELREDKVWKICKPFEAEDKSLLIDVKPYDSCNVINPNSQGVIPVTIFGSDEVNVGDIAMETMTFGVTGDESSLSHYNYMDLDYDGYEDLMLHFYTNQTSISCTTEKLILKAKDISGK